MSKRKRRHQGLLDIFIDISIKLPWWLSFFVGVTLYFVLHYYAARPLPPVNPVDMASLLIAQMVRAASAIGQYALPAIFGIGGLISLSKKDFKPNTFHHDLPPTLYATQPDEVATEMPAINMFEPRLRINRSQEPTTQPRAWSLKVLQEMDWKRFEELCGEYFKLCGFKTLIQAAGADGGVDIKLYPKTAPDRLENLVQCKQWQNRIVGVRDIRALLGSMAAAKVNRGTFVTSSKFSLEAVAFAEKNRIHLIDGEQLLKRISSRPVSEQAELLAFATAGDYKTPSCPSCGAKLVEKTNKKDRSPFWACPKFPSCRYTLRMRRRTDSKQAPARY